MLSLPKIKSDFFKKPLNITAIVIIFAAFTTATFLYFNDKKPYIDHTHYQDEMSKNISYHLDDYRDKIIDLQNPISKDIFLEQAFSDDNYSVKPATEIYEEEIYRADNWQLIFYSDEENTKPVLEGFEVHKSVEENTNINNYNKIVPDLASSLKNQIVVQNDRGVQPLNAELLYSITGFESKKQIKDFLYLYYKLINQNSSKLTDSDRYLPMSELTPLLFDDYYYFSNYINGNDRFGCGDKFEGNLQATYDEQSKQVTFYTHGSSATPNSSLVKITLKRAGNNFEVVERQSLLFCMNQIMC